MRDNELRDGKRNGSQTDTQYVIREFKNSVVFIQENWTDDLGANFVKLLQNAETELTKIECRKVALTENISSLRKRLYSIFDDDSNPVLKKKKVLKPSGNNYDTDSGRHHRVK